MTNYPKIIGAMPVEGETVVLTFEIGGAHKLYSVRCKDFISQNKGMKIVRKHNCFSKLRIEDYGGAIEWETPDGEAGIAGDVLFRLAKLQAGEVQGGDKLKQWKEEFHLTHAQMAEELGVTERTIVNYLQKPERIPKYILLAIDGWISHQSLSPQAS